MLKGFGSLPKIDNAIPGRDGYEIEIFGMEGIPAPDVADYKRRKEIELGLAAGSISQPQPKRPKIENRVLTEFELRKALEQHKALMGRTDTKVDGVDSSAAGAGGVYGAEPQVYAQPTGPTPFMPGMPPPGQPPFPFPGFPPGGPGLPPPG